MNGAPISELNQGLQLLKQSLDRDPLASKRVEVAVVSFNSKVTVEQSFVTPDAFSPRTLLAGGTTAMGAGRVCDAKVTLRSSGDLNFEIIRIV